MAEQSSIRIADLSVSDNPGSELLPPTPIQATCRRRRISKAVSNKQRPAVGGDFGICPGEYTFWHVNFQPGLDCYSTVRDRGGNFVFTDGHAEYCKAAKSRARDFGLANGSSGKADDTQTANDLACYKRAFA